MTVKQRTLAYVAIALIVGAGLALAVALAQGGGDNKAAADAAARADRVARGGLYSEEGVSGTAPEADPAKIEPLLDKFTSKDPFGDMTKTESSSATTSTSTSASSSALSAKVKVDGTSYAVANGTDLPGGSSPAFTVTAVTSSDVTFSVNDGSLKNGQTSVTVGLGEAVKATLKSGKSYSLSVSSIGGTTASAGTGGHSISVLSISSQNDNGMATFEVDGQTYSDKVVGNVFDTSWGEIEVLAIDVAAQTVTIKHGDQTLTLQAGQVVAK